MSLDEVPQVLSQVSLGRVRAHARALPHRQHGKPALLSARS
jgi:hypothetical protein